MSTTQFYFRTLQQEIRCHLQKRCSAIGAIISFAAVHKYLLANICRIYVDGLVMLPTQKLYLYASYIHTYALTHIYFVCARMFVYVVCVCTAAQCKHLLMFSFCSGHCFVAVGFRSFCLHFAA